MRRQSPTRLEEAADAAPPGATIIDADYDIVGAERRRAKPRPARAPKPPLSFFTQLKRALFLAGLVVLVGLLLPPTVVLVSFFLRQWG